MASIIESQALDQLRLGFPVRLLDTSEEGARQNQSKQQPAAPRDGAIYPQYSIQLQLAPLGVRLENGKHPTLSLFFVQTTIY